ncbi:MAG: efflux RND transporter periplasmic adaptor subunit [Planctomycetia bacterium]|nr:efflux RND transporter periplasmic adaptor subunit [Planctomycetia bacterium]
MTTRIAPPLVSRRTWFELTLATVALLLLGFMVLNWRKAGGEVRSLNGNGNENGNASPTAAAVAEQPKLPAVDRVRFERSRWGAAGVRVEPVRHLALNDVLSVTGKLAVDEERLAHIYSQVEGVLREAKVRLGQAVKAGDVLAIVDSKEVGQAKLDLVRNRMNLGFAKTTHQWSETIMTNTLALTNLLEQGPEVTTLDSQIRDQPMGDNRQLLISSYAKRHQTQADYERLKTLRAQNVGVEKDFIRSKAEYESAAATYQAIVEQLKFTTKQKRIEADQKLQEALTAERMSRASLLILGYGEKEIDAMDPLAEGEKMAHYPIRAPFDGTVVEKHAVLSEHVGPAHQLYEITDLAKVWIHAAVFEKDLSSLLRMSDKPLKFHSAGYPDREFTAELFHMGDEVDEKTRAVTLIAVAQNNEHLLKPGMFVDVRLPIGESAARVQIPESAVQRQEQNYVYVLIGDDEFERREVRLGRTIKPYVEVAAGLKEGESIVVEGCFELKSLFMKDLLAD